MPLDLSAILSNAHPHRRAGGAAQTESVSDRGAESASSGAACMRCRHGIRNLDGGRGLAEVARHEAGAAFSTKLVHVACCRLHDTLRTAMPLKTCAYSSPHPEQHQTRPANTGLHHSSPNSTARPSTVSQSAPPADSNLTDVAHELLPPAGPRAQAVRHRSSSEREHKYSPTSL